MSNLDSSLKCVGSLHSEFQTNAVRIAQKSATGFAQSSCSIVPSNNKRRVLLVCTYLYDNCYVRKSMVMVGDEATSVGRSD